MKTKIKIISLFFIIFCVAAEDVSADTISESDLFGIVPAWIMTTGNTRDYMFATEVGINTTRTKATWSLIEPTEGLYEWDATTHYMDTAIEHAQEAGISVAHITIDPQPPRNWASCKNATCNDPGNISSYPYAQCLYADANQVAHENYTKALVERYDGDGVDDMPGLVEGVKYWRMGMEMEPRTWCGTGAEFITFYEETYAAIKEADPEAKLIFGGLHSAVFECVVDVDCKSEWFASPEGADAQAGVDLFHYIYSNIDDSHVDAWGIHPYYNWNNIPQRIDAFREYLVENGKTIKDIWIPEDGEAVRYAPIDATTDKRQSEEIIKRFVIAVSRDIKNYNWYDMFYYGSYLPGADWANMALLEYDASIPTYIDRYLRRPGFYTYQLLIEKIGSYSFSKVVSEDDSDFYGYKFLNEDNDPLWVFWTYEGEKNVALNTNYDVVVTDIITERGETEAVVTEVKNTGEPVSLTLDTTPIFVTLGETGVFNEETEGTPVESGELDKNSKKYKLYKEYKNKHTSDSHKQDYKKVKNLKKKNYPTYLKMKAVYYLYKVAGDDARDNLEQVDPETYQMYKEYRRYKKYKKYKEYKEDVFGD